MGCVARLILCSPPLVPTAAPGPDGTAAVPLPLDAVLPVYLAALPPGEDWEECHVSYRALCELLLSAEPSVTAALAPFVAGVVGTFGAAVGHAKLPPATRAMIVETVGRLRAQYPGQLDPLLQALPADQAAALLGGAPQ